MKKPHCRGFSHASWDHNRGQFLVLVVRVILFLQFWSIKFDIIWVIELKLQVEKKSPPRMYCQHQKAGRFFKKDGANTLFRQPDPPTKGKHSSVLSLELQMAVGAFFCPDWLTALLLVLNLKERHIPFYFTNHTICPCFLNLLFVHCFSRLD